MWKTLYSIAEKLEQIEVPDVAADIGYSAPGFIEMLRYSKFQILLYMKKKLFNLKKLKYHSSTKFNNVLLFVCLKPFMTKDILWWHCRD